MKYGPGVFGTTIEIDEISKREGGLTKRELFAALAMQGLLASGSRGSLVDKYAVQSADALLKELEKTNENKNNS